MITKRKALGSHNIAWSIAMVGALLHPMAQAAFKTPPKTSNISVSVDGNAVDISITANRATPGALVASADALSTSITQNVTGATNGNVVNRPTTTSGSGSGARVSLLVAGNAVSDVTVVSEGSGYAAGDTLTVAASDIPNASQNLVIQLVADDIDNLEALPFAAFGNGNSEGNGLKELSLLRAVKGPSPSGEVRLLAQGGVIEKSCAGGGTQYYQRARVTLSGLPSNGAKDVWAFYDPRVGATGGNPNVQRGQPHFNAKSGFNDAWPRITNAGDQIKLCDNTTPYVDGTAGVLTLGNGGEARPTAGMKKVVDDNVTQTSFDVYVPMEGRADSITTGITLAMGFVVNVGQDALNDESADVAFEAWVSSEPWWDTPPGQGGNTTDEFNTLLPACAASPAANDPACFVKASSGVFYADGTTRVRDEDDFSVWTTQITPEQGNGFDSIIELGRIAPLNGGDFAITSGWIVKMTVSWPTAGQLYPGVNGSPEYGQGVGKIDLLKLVADTPVKVDTTTAAIDDNKNKWSNARVSNRVVTTLIGEARTTSAAISRETWWPQCDVTFDESNAVVSKKCGADMASNVTSDYMVFSSVPARLAVIVDSLVDKVAGGLVSTNGQGFSFGRQTFDADDPAYEFTSSGPSYNSAGAARTADGFYYVCLPATYLDQVHGTDAATAKSSWIGTRKDGAQTRQNLASVAFAPGTCGLNDAGLVAKVAQFGYSSPVFQLKSGVPGQPTITQVTMGNGQAVVTFTAPASPGSSAITQYVVTANPGGITKDCGTTSPCTVTGLTNGTNYTFTITATNSNGTSSPSAGYSSGATSIQTLPTALLLLLSLGLLSLVRLKGISRR
jgi:hypothetical protein